MCTYTLCPYICVNTFLHCGKCLIIEQMCRFFFFKSDTVYLASYLFFLCSASQGVTAIQNPREPFKKSSMFSTPISQRLDEIDPQYNNLDWALPFTLWDIYIPLWKCNKHIADSQLWWGLAGLHPCQTFFQHLLQDLLRPCMLEVLCMQKTAFTFLQLQHHAGKFCD